MKKATYTPGSWTAESESINSITIRATSKSAHKQGQEITTVINEDDSTLTPTMWANARLVAAAPDLYEALKATCCRFSRAKECKGADKCDRCAALALAEGQS